MTFPVILMYHGIVSCGADAPLAREQGAQLYDVTAVDFCRQLEIIKKRNLKVGLLADGENENRPELVLTFDDGETNNFENAAPVLKEFGYPAYFFVTTSRVGEPGYMGVAELRQLHARGMAVGSHGLTHDILTQLGDEELLENLKGSKVMLERMLNASVADFSVPRGFYDERVLRLAREAGYKNIFVSEKNQPLDQCLGRVAVKKNWTPARFEMALCGKVPSGEEFLQAIKRAIIKTVGPQAYDGLRTKILKHSS